MKNIISWQKTGVLKNLKICLRKSYKLNRHDNKCTHKKISRTGLEKITELQNISENEINQVKKLKKKINR